jgi:hypothetical protein
MAKSLIIVLRYLLWSLCAIAVGSAISDQRVRAADPPRAGAFAATAMTYPVLMQRLRAAGATADPVGRIDQPFFSVAGKALTVDGEDVQVFEYATAAAAEGDARRVSPDGSAIGTSKPLWIGTPHFYRQGRLLVLYLGDQKKIIQALEAALGRQFAGQ